MLNLLLVVALSCPNTKVINETKAWNYQDALTLGKAVNRCKEIYPEAPCLKKFIKKGDNRYWAICGKKI